MELLITIIVTFFAGMGAGLGTGFAGMSAALFANKAAPKTLNRVTGIILVILGAAVLLFSVFT